MKPDQEYTTLYAKILETLDKAEAQLDKTALLIEQNNLRISALSKERPC